MKFGVRDICDVVFKAKNSMTIGTATFKQGQPVLYIDTATASTLEQATTTVYAQGGKGNTRLIAWEGEKTLTFTVTDALLSPIGLSILSGAGLFKSTTEFVHVHMTANGVITKSDNGNNGTIDLSGVLGKNEFIDNGAPVFIAVTEDDGSLTGTMLSGFKVAYKGDSGITPYTSNVISESAISSTALKCQYLIKDTLEDGEAGKNVFIDFYTVRASASVSEIQIDASSFGGNFYVEASTLFRDQATGHDMPCEITLPNVKVQSNFTFSMAATGDPSTFDFTMDAFPGYTMFDNTHKVLCVMQVIEDTDSGSTANNTVMGHDKLTITESANDSTAVSGEPVSTT